MTDLDRMPTETFGDDIAGRLYCALIPMDNLARRLRQKARANDPYKDRVMAVRDEMYRILNDRLTELGL